jgi:hypothetical protein
MGKKQKMLRMATKRNSVGTETPIKSMDKKMRTKRIKRRRTRAKEVRAQIEIKEETVEIGTDRKRGRAGERTWETLSMTMRCQEEKEVEEAWEEWEVEEEVLEEGEEEEEEDSTWGLWWTENILVDQDSIQCTAITETMAVLEALSQEAMMISSWDHKEEDVVEEEEAVPQICIQLIWDTTLDHQEAMKIITMIKITMVDQDQCITVQEADITTRHEDNMEEILEICLLRAAQEDIETGLTLTQDRVSHPWVEEECQWEVADVMIFPMMKEGTTEAVEVVEEEETETMAHHTSVEAWDLQEEEVAQMTKTTTKRQFSTEEPEVVVETPSEVTEVAEVIMEVVIEELQYIHHVTNWYSAAQNLMMSI